MGIYLEKLNNLPELPDAIKLMIPSVAEAYRYCDDFEGEPKIYSTYKLITPEGILVLKQSEDEEDFAAESKHLALLKGLPAPKLIGAADGFILMEYVEGDDLKSASDEGVLAAAHSLAEVMNAFPMGRGYERERYEQYIRRLEKRAERIKSEPELSAAFTVFLEREREIPLTLSNGDLLPINVLFDGKKATIIDWGFGGFMPYALDIARFIAHGRVTGGASPFRMTDDQKKLFVDAVYNALEVKPERAVFDRDITLAVYNELIEILEYYFREPDAERGETFRDYYARAKELAGKVTGNR